MHENIGSFEIECSHDVYIYRDVWDDLLKASGADTIFLNFQWLACWLRSVGKDQRQFLVIIKEAGRIVAIAPLIIVEHIECGIRWRRLQIIGSPQADYLDFLIVGDRSACLQAIYHFLQTRSHLWDYCELFHISGDSKNRSAFEELAKKNSGSCSITEFSVCPYVDLRLNFEQYLKSLPKGLRYDMRRGEKELNLIGNLRFEKLEDRSAAVKELPGFFNMLAAREEASGRRRSRVGEERLQGLMRSFVEDGQFWNYIYFSRMTLDNQPIAYHLGFEYRGKIYWYKPTFDQRYAKFVPGKIMIKYSMEYAVQKGLNEFDFLLGDEPYKFQWTTEKRSSYNVFIVNSTMSSKAIRSWLYTWKPFLKNSSLVKKIRRSVGSR